MCLVGPHHRERQAVVADGDDEEQYPSGDHFPQGRALTLRPKSSGGAITRTRPTSMNSEVRWKETRGWSFCFVAHLRVTRQRPDSP
jgi:hypothetical protein